MYRSAVGVLMAALSVVPAVAADSRDRDLAEHLNKPYIELFDLSDDTPFPSSEIKSLRSRLEQERKQAVETCEGAIEALEKQLEAARDNLKAINETPAAAKNRSDLHQEITALETSLQEKRTELRDAVPAAFDNRLAKLKVIEEWPERRAELEKLIEDNKAHLRKFGDVQDIGYRAVAEGQEEDVELGGQTFRSLRASGLMPDAVPDLEIQNYLQRLAGLLAESSDLKIPLHMAVLDSPEVKAMSLPGGFLFVHAGLLEKVETESQLAAVISHEIAKIAARHGHRATKRSTLSKFTIQAAKLAVGLFTGGVGSAAVQYGLTYGFQGLGVLKGDTAGAESESNEAEADQLGVQYAWKAGFDPKGSISFLDAMSETYPSTSKRLLNLFSEIHLLPRQRNLRVDSADFQQMKTRLGQ